MWLFEAATRIVPIVPTLCARTTGAAAGVGVGVGVAEGEGDGDAVAAGPLVVLPHAASNSARPAPTMVARINFMFVGTGFGYG